MTCEQSVGNRVRLRIARQVKGLRTAAGLTQEQLAHRSGIAPRHLQKIESGGVNVTVDTLVKVANALAVDVQRFFAGE